MCMPILLTYLHTVRASNLKHHKLAVGFRSNLMVNNDKLIRGTKYKHKKLCDICFVASDSTFVSDLHPE